MSKSAVFFASDATTQLAAKKVQHTTPVDETLQSRRVTMLPLTVAEHYVHRFVLPILEDINT